MDETILNYHITAKLYESAHSLIYRAQPQGQPSVVLKVLQPPHPTSDHVARFWQEYELTRKARADGVIQVYSLEAYADTFVMVLEDFGGEALVSWLTRRQWTLTESLTLALRIAESLGLIHAAQVVHKNLNPANILWNPQTNQLKIIDFGLATILSTETPAVTHTNLLEAALPYISPEQTGRMNRSLDYRTDLYSLGVMLYEMLTGHCPFEGAEPMEIVYNHLTRIPPALQSYNPNIPEPVTAVVMRLLEKNAEDRYQSAFGVQYDLTFCLEQFQQLGTIPKFDIGGVDFSTKLHIPQKLYGRETEITTLLNVFDEICLGKKDFVLVTGYAGVGKTALVHEIHRPITRQHGYFGEGKFDQYHQNIPYSAWLQAFTGIIEQVLSESEQRLADWRTAILHAVGTTGKVLIEVLPMLELIIGPQPDVPVLGGTEAQNRFHYTLQQFVRAIAQNTHPLVIFLDDLQWIDAASLRLLQVLLTDTELQSFLLIGAYRDNEVETTHPLSLMLETLHQDQIPQKSLILSNLTEEHVNTLIAEALHCPPSESRILTQLVYSKTAGNAFFTRQLLHTLVEQGGLAVDVTRRCWTWDLAALQAMEITDNVVAFLVQKIQKLLLTTQDLLKLAACIGNQFDTATLMLIAEHPETSFWREIHHALQEGFLISLAGQYKFAHDRIQQAAYSLIPETERSAVHWRIGTRLLQHLPKAQQTEQLFTIVNQLNKGRDQRQTPDDCLVLAELNQQAGHKAKAATAYAAAREYFVAGLASLNELHWNSHYALTLSLHQDAVEACYLCGHYDQMTQLADHVHHRAQHLLDEIPVYGIEIKALTAQGRLLDAIRHGLAALERLGMPLSETPTDDETWGQFQRTLDLLQQVSLERIRELPQMTAPDKLASLTILSEIGEPAYAAAPGLFILWASRMADLSLRYGHTPLAPFAYAAYALALCASQQQIETGYRLAKVAMSLLEPLQARSAKCRVFNIYGGTIQSWIEPLRNTVPVLEEGIASGMETGDYTSGSYNAFALSMYAYFMGEPLVVLEQRLERNLHTIAYFRLTYLWNWVASYRSAVRRLQNITESSNAPDVFDAMQWLSAARKASDKCGLCHFFLNKLILAYLFDAHDETAADAAEVWENFAGFQGTFAVPVFYFYDSLASLQRCPNRTAEQRVALLAHVRDNQQKLHHLAQFAPQNFQHKYDLVTAELARVEGQFWQAAQSYEKAIAGARTNQFIQEEALAYELSAKFYLEQDMAEIAQLYMTHAYDCYGRWQAVAKVQLLERRYPQWFAAPIASSVETTGTDWRRLDIESVMRAAQAISSEIELEPLLRRLMQILLENAGAQKGCLILEQQGQWVIAAERDSTDPEGRILQAFPLADSDTLAVNIVNYVIRTHQNVLLDDAAAGNFANDLYILKRQPKSIFCMPLMSSGKVRGILYLENDLVVGAFTADRVRVLEILAIQAAISLENARYYAELKQLNASLTQEITERKRIEDALQESQITLEIALEIGKADSWTMDFTTGALTYTSRWAALLGYEPDEIPMTIPAITAIIHPDDVPRNLAAMQAYLEGKTPVYETECRIRTKQGLWVWVVSRGKAVAWNSAGQPTRLLGTNFDITERKQMEDALLTLNAELEQRVTERTAKFEAANNELQSFAYVVSHDLKAPLRGISHLVDWLVQDYAQAFDDQGKAMAHLLTNRVQRMDTLIEGILEYSRIGRVVEHATPVDLQRLLPEIIDMLAPPPNVSITLPSDFPVLIGDKTRIMQVFQNLIGNAIKFMDKPQGEIQVGCTETGDLWQFSVTDNGPGIDSKYHTKIFQIFQTLRPRDEVENTGIGLSIVKKIVELYGGRIWLESEVGQGSTFYFTLPKS